MGSSEPGRSISSTIPLPQWMKSKINDRYDIDQPFSPPSNDDTFFYIRYPKSTQSNVQPTPERQQFRPISEVLEKNPDFSKHTPPCQEFIPQTKASINVPEVSVMKPKKSQGTDDGFTGEGAACGKSVVHVAQQMIAGNFVARNFNDTGDDSLYPTESYDFGRRRGSRSLPASPLGTPQSSPRIVRKPNHNRYFTGTAAPTDKSAQESKYQSWMMAGFLGQREQLAIPEENKSLSREDLTTSDLQVEKLEISSGLRRNKSAVVFGTATDTADVAQQATSAPRVVRPKPSGLREMNFWSPTSM